MVRIRRNIVSSLILAALRGLLPLEYIYGLSEYRQKNPLEYYIPPYLAGVV